MKKTVSVIVVWCSIVAATTAQSLSGVRIYINPGHGGYDSDDRNMTVYPYTQGDHNSFWESQSNLDKGQQLKVMLDAAGATTAISRVTNTTADDLPLSTIVALANSFNADFMLSIHSNAGGGLGNYVLMLYAGIDVNDTQQSYPTATPYSDESRAISTVIAQNLQTNQINCWSTSNYAVRGDKTYARTAMNWSDGYGVLRGLRVPGVISEGSMHDYIPETYRLLNMEYKWMEAWHFYKSFCSYFNAGAIPTGNIAGSIRDGNNKIMFPEFTKLKNSRDELLPLNGSTVQLLHGTDTLQTYTVDNLYNGFFLFKNLPPDDYELVVNVDDYYQQRLPVTVTASNITYANIDMNMVRSTPPEVVSYTPNPLSPTDSVEVATSVVLNFNWDMDATATRNAFSITPEVAGTITFENSYKTLRFTPDQPLDKATTYTVRLSTAACHPDNTQNNHLENDFVLVFTTKNRNRLSIKLNFPAENDTVELAPSFVLLFDKKLSTANLTTTNLPTLLVVQDAQGNVITPNARQAVKNSAPQPYGSLMFELVNDMLPNTNYSLTVGSAITDETGVTLVEPVVIPFRTGSGNSPVQPVITDFETVAYTYQPAQSLSTASASVMRSTAKKRFGTSSNEFRYTFNDNDGEACFAPVDLSNTMNSTMVAGVHIFGDFSFNEVWVEFSVDGDIKAAQLATLNFAGWKYCEVVLKDILPAGVDYQLTGLKIVRCTGILSASGTICLDNMMRYPYVETNTDPTVFYGELSVYPNPFADYVLINGVAQSGVAVICDLHGKVVLTAAITEGNNRIDTSTLSHGVYILRAGLQTVKIVK